MSLMASSRRGPGKPGGILVLLVALLPGLLVSCRHLPPAPEGFNPEDYTPVTLAQLKEPHQAGLAQGQRVSVAGYFWQYLEYDPFMAAQYLAILRRPLSESRQRWASLYDSAQLQGYYDRLVLTRDQRRDWNLKRLEHVRIYGQLTNLGVGILYLKTHHVDRLDGADSPPGPGPAAPYAPGKETPNP
jgi:hypothetical protein